jgi:RNA polymerase sigma factor (sigma-70 family)
MSTLHSPAGFDAGGREPLVPPSEPALSAAKSASPDIPAQGAEGPLNPAEKIELEFRTLLSEVRQGSEEAAWKLIDKYGHHILRVVRNSLHDQLRSKFDSQDFVQAVWASFFTSRSKIISFHNANDLVGFLVTAARNKVVDEYRRRLLYEKYNVRREVSLDDRTQVRKEQLPANQATPSEVAVARERWYQLMEDQPEVYRRVISLRFRGETFESIAQAVGLKEWNVRRFLEQLFGESS